MPATLSEAFGQNYDSYPPSEIQQKRKKKNSKGKNYGQEVPQHRFTSPEPKKELNLTIGGYPEDDDNFLKISNSNEYGPTDYNIKPQDVQEYMFQLNDPNQTVKGAQVHNATNYIDTYGSIPTNAPGNSIVFRPTSMPTNNLIENYNQDVDSDSEDEMDVSSKRKQMQKQTNKMAEKMDMHMDIKMMEFNSKLDAIMEKLKHFDEPAQENIHDIILFVIFGCFVIFILDSVYRVGKMTL